MKFITYFGGFLTLSLSLSMHAMEQDKTTKTTKTIFTIPPTPNQDQRPATPSPRQKLDYPKAIILGSCDKNQSPRQVNQECHSNNQNQKNDCGTSPNQGQNNQDCRTQNQGQNNRDCHTQNQGQNNQNCRTQNQGQNNCQNTSNNQGCETSRLTRPGANVSVGACTNHAHIDIKPSTKVSLLSCDKDVIAVQHWTQANVSDCYFENTRFEHITIKNAKLNNIFFHGEFKHLDFDLSDITNTTFKGKLQDVDFKNAKLENVLFTDSTIKSRLGDRSSFDNANLINVLFENCTLEKGISFKNVHLNNVSFMNTTINNSNIFKNAYVLYNDGWIHLTGKAWKFAKTRILGITKGTNNTNDWLCGYQK